MTGMISDQFNGGGTGFWHPISPCKPVTFQHHGTECEFSPVIMNVFTLNKPPCLERLLGFELTDDLMWTPIFLPSLNTRVPCTISGCTWVVLPCSISVFSVWCGRKARLICHKFQKKTKEIIKHIRFFFHWI